LGLASLERAWGLADLAGSLARGHGTNRLAPVLTVVPQALRSVMNNPDQDTVLRAIEDARRILGEYIEPGPRDATRTVEQQLAILDRNDVVHALDRIYRRRVLRLIE
jgi:hypothetical protein